MATVPMTLLDELCEALILADAGDLPALAGIHSMFEDLEAEMTRTAQVRAADAARAAAALVEEIILGEAADPAGALRSLTQTVSSLLEVYRDGTDLDSAVLPVLGDAMASQPATFILPEHVDEAIFAEFLSRQPAVLDELEERILALERDASAEALSAIRGIIHTLKGEAGLLGLEPVGRLCHTAEEALTPEAARGASDLLLTMKDWLGRAFDAYAGRGVFPDGVDVLAGRFEVFAHGAAGAAPVAAHPEEDAPPQPLQGDRDLLQEFVQEATEHLDAADLHILSLESDARNDEALNAVFRAFHTIKGVAGFIALDDVQTLAHQAENLLDKARKGDLELNAACIDVTFEAVDLLKQMIAQVARALASDGLLHRVPGLRLVVARLKAAAEGTLTGAPTAPSDAVRLGEILVERGAATEDEVAAAVRAQALPPVPDPLGEMLIQHNLVTRAQVLEALEYQEATGAANRLGEILVEAGALAQEDLDRVVQRQAEGPKPARLGEILVKSGATDARDVASALRSQRQGQVQVREPVKVDADRLDRLVDTIGELVIAESMVRSGIERGASGSAELVSHLNQLDKITRELQEMGMSLRMVPVRATFQKMARLVRDLAKKSGKPVDFVVTGEDTELDKSVVDKIGDPLVHMVRNAVDHGLESSAEDRVKAGKPAAGRVELRAFHKGGCIHIEIQDDGRGLNREAILAKARERGLIRDGDVLGDREVWNLIFEPGFSTAKAITDVSGRGVGMDVVRRNIEALRGQIEIHSEEGRGTTFSIRLPLTLAIIDGMVVRVGAERYIVPTLSIIRSVRPESGQISRVIGKGELLSLQGDLVPLFRLSRLFGLDDAVDDPAKGIVVIVEDEGRKIGLLTDELLGQQQTVIKSLGDSMKDVRGVAGGAIMPDGRIGLILDVSGIVRMATDRPEDMRTHTEAEAVLRR